MPVRTWATPTIRRSSSWREAGTAMSRPLEALGQALGFDGMRTIGDARLAAGLARGEDLARIAEPVRVPRLAHAAHGVQVRLGEDERHVVHLLEPDAVLARDGAADVRADLEDLSARLDHALDLARLARIVEDVRVEVAVAGVEHVAHAQLVG